MAPQEPIRRRPAPPGPTREIPDKLYFRIGEVAKLCEVPAYVLRFWEGEFPQLRPNKGGTGQRLYRRRDVEMALRVKALLYDEGYTIPGARQAFKAELRGSKDPQMALDGVAQTFDLQHLIALQKELREVHALLSKPTATKQTVQPIRGGRGAGRGAGRGDGHELGGQVHAAPKPGSKPTLLPSAKPQGRSLRSDSLFDFDEPTE